MQHMGKEYAKHTKFWNPQKCEVIPILRKPKLSFLDGDKNEDKYGEKAWFRFDSELGNIKITKNGNDIKATNWEELKTILNGCRGFRKMSDLRLKIRFDKLVFSASRNVFSCRIIITEIIINETSYDFGFEFKDDNSEESEECEILNIKIPEDLEKTETKLAITL